MPSALLLDPEEFVAPVPGPDPAGRRLSAVELIKLKEYQEDFDPERDLSEEERQSPQFAEAQRKTPQWAAVIDFGTKFLKATGKDLELVVRMVEALTKTRNGGFAGVRTGFRLVRRLCEECWDAMHPALDPDDPDSIEDRTSKFNWLDDAEKKPYFPTSVRGIPVFTLQDGRPVSFLACQQQGTRPAEVSQEEFRQGVAAARAADVDRVREMDEDITEALAEVRDLLTVLDAKAGAAAPGLGAVRKALVDCQTMTRQVLKLRGDLAGNGAGAGAGAGAEPGVGAPPGQDHGPAAGPNGPSTALNPVRTREDIYARLAELIALLEESDPHSPVPLLIRRAVELRDLKFPDLVDTLTRDARVLDFLRPQQSG